MTDKTSMFAPMRQRHTRSTELVPIIDRIKETLNDYVLFVLTHVGEAVDGSTNERVIRANGVDLYVPDIPHAEFAEILDVGAGCKTFTAEHIRARVWTPDAPPELCWLGEDYYYTREKDLLPVLFGDGDTLTALGRHVVVQMDRKFVEGVELPDEAQLDSTTGVVTSAGDKCRYVVAGDRVWMPWDVKIYGVGGVAYAVLGEDDVLAKE